MKRLISYTALSIGLMAAVFLPACQKKVAAYRTVSIRATNPEPLADGSQLDTIYADLPINAVQADLAVTFQTTLGLFSNGMDTMTVIASRTDIDKGMITAVAIWKASLLPGTDTITVSTNTIPQVVNLLKLKVDTSFADSIHLETSSFAVQASFGSEVTITGTLYNKYGGMVSQGNMVTFSDTYQGGGAVGGKYRLNQPSSDTLSQVSTIYSPGPTAVTGQYLYITAAILGSNGQPTGKTGSVPIYILPYTP